MHHRQTKHLFCCAPGFKYIVGLLKKPLFDCPIRLKGNLKYSCGNFWIHWWPRTKSDLGTALQLLLAMVWLQCRIIEWIIVFVSGCITGIAPHLPELIPFLINSLSEKRVSTTQFAILNPERSLFSVYMIREWNVVPEREFHSEWKPEWRVREQNVILVSCKEMQKTHYGELIPEWKSSWYHVNSPLVYM